MDLKDKSAIVTGGAVGIGFSIARSLLENGVSVAILDCNKEKGEASTKLLQEEFGATKVVFYSCDVAVKDELQGAVKEAVNKFSRLDIFVNNAGISTCNPRWEYVIEVNLLGVMRGAEEAVKYMSKESGGCGGVVVNMASVLGLMPFAEMAPYAASKHAIIGFTRSLGCPEVYEASGIRHIAICPGFTATELTMAVPEECVNALAQSLNIPPNMQRPENVAACVLEAIKGAPSGSLWLVEDDVPGYEIAIPYYKSIRKTPV